MKRRSINKSQNFLKRNKFMKDEMMINKGEMEELAEILRIHFCGFNKFVLREVFLMVLWNLRGKRSFFS